MYVEVTGRQTGKTTRLIDSVVDFLIDNPDKTALIVSPDPQRKLIQEKVYLKCGRPCEYRTITSYKMLPPVKEGSIRQFVDEFGLVKDMTWKRIKMKIAVGGKIYEFTNPLRLLKFDYLIYHRVF